MADQPNSPAPVLTSGVTTTSAAAELAKPIAPLDGAKLVAGDAVERARLEQQTAAAALTDEQRLAVLAAGASLAGPEVTVDGALSNADMTTAVEYYRSMGLNYTQIAEIFSGKKFPPEQVRTAVIKRDMYLRDPKWVERWQGGDPLAAYELLIVEGIISNGPIGSEP